jgi:putative CocE/NonD family hydrolase
MHSDDIALDIARYDRPAGTEFAIVRNVMVPMRDGVRLATDIYRPTTPDGELLPGPFPVIVDRTPYEKVPRALRNDPEYFARRGYVFVFQDARGHGDSEGEYYVYTSEGIDGIDCIEWVARQPWCNGQIGTSGFSHDAATQNAVGRESCRHVSAMFPAFCSSNYHNDVAGHGGAYRLSHNFVYTVLHSLLDRRAKSDPGLTAKLHQVQANMFEWFKSHPDKHERLFRDVPAALQWYQDWLDHPDLDDYWKQNAYYFEGFYDRYPDVPTFFMGGYYDFCELGTVTNYEGVAAAHRSPTFLMLGPWCHGPHNALRTWAGEVEFGESSAVDWNPIRLAFFDEVLKRIDTGLFDPGTSVKIFVMGGGRGTKTPEGRIEHGGYWTTGGGWPLDGTLAEDYFITGPGVLARDGSASPGSCSFLYDPADPVIQIGGDYTYPFAMGPMNQVRDPSVLGCDGHLPVEERPDILTFETNPLDEVAGHIWVELFVSSDAVDTDFTAKLIDQYPASEDYPNGFAMLLTDSIIRLRYRESLEHPTPYTPGEVVKVRIDVRVVANLFKAGHRIRLDVSSSNFPSFDPNPNTGEPIGRHTHTRVARNVIHFGPDQPSKLILPVRHR